MRSVQPPDLAFIREIKTLELKVCTVNFNQRNTSKFIENNKIALQNFLFVFNLLDFNIKNHKILFEDRKSIGEQQIKFDGTPFIIIGNQLLDCIHGCDHHTSSILKTQNAKKNIKVCIPPPKF